MSDQKTIIAATNGPIVGVDDTGVVLHLSDRVLRDIVRRLPELGMSPEAAGKTAPTSQGDTAWIEDDIDWWNARKEGDWTQFDARLPGTGDSRRYLRHVSGPGIMADTPGALQVLASLGGSRRYTQQSAQPDFPYHVIACPPPEPGETPLFANLTHRGIDSAICDILLHQRLAAFQRLPSFAIQPCLLPPTGLPDQTDLAEFRQGIQRLTALAAAMDKPVQMAAIVLELGPQHLDPSLDPDILHRASLKFLDKIATEIRAAGLGETPILLTADAGAWWNCDVLAARKAAEALQRLVLCPGTHRIIPVGSTTGLMQDDLGMPANETIACQAALEARVIDTVLRGHICDAPVLYLAEYIGPNRIRATFKTRGGLGIDGIRHEQTGPGAGLSATLTDTGADWPINTVERDPQDRGALIVTLQSDPPPGHELRLDHALPRQAGENVGFPATAIFDAAEDESATLQFWAMPASMVVR
ncbi:MAG: hypothetical protein ACK5II_02175 [Paracoccus sp. (in: a-proteobacteria)]